MKPPRYTIVVGRELTLDNNPYCCGGPARPSPGLFLFPERYLHPAIVRERVVPEILREGQAGPVTVVTHAQGIITALGDEVAAGRVAPADVVILIARRPSCYDPGAAWPWDAWGCDHYTFDAEGNLSDGWPIGYLEP